MRILVAVDLSMPSHDALLARTARFARQADGVVDIAYVHRADASLAEIDNYEARLKGLLAMIEEGRRGQARLVVGDEVDDAIAGASADYELVVVGPREPGALERLVKGVMSVRVLRKAHSPVLIPRGERPWGDPPRLVLGVDIEGEGQEELVDRAAEWAGRLSATLDVVYAVAEMLPQIREAQVAERAEREWQARHGEEQETLEALLARVPEARRGQALLKRGDPETVLVQASESADLVVVGNRERQGLSGWLLGAVARPVARLAVCDVLALNTAEPVTS